MTRHRTSLAAAVLAAVALAASAAPPAGAAARMTDCPKLTKSPSFFGHYQHKNADCRTARKLSLAFSRDNSEPYGWACNFVTRRGYDLVTCADVPGVSVQIVRWRAYATRR